MSNYLNTSITEDEGDAKQLKNKNFPNISLPNQEGNGEIIPQENEVNFKKQGLPENKELEKVMEGVRGMGRIYYDYFNNGSCNTLEIVSENNGWDGDREIIDEETGEEEPFEEWDVVEGFDEYYQKCVDSICAVLGNEYESKLLDICSEFALHNRWREDEMEDIAEELHKIAWGVYKGNATLKERNKSTKI